MNIYNNENTCLGAGYVSKEKADIFAGHSRIACVKVDWVEGDGLQDSNPSVRRTGNWRMSTQSLALDLYLDIQKDKLEELDRVNNRIYDILSIDPVLKTTRATIFKGLEKVAIKYQQQLATRSVSYV